MSENEKLPPPVNLKHRLIGAALLVAAAVIVLPLILREQEPPVELKPATEAPAKETVVEQAPLAVSDDSRDDAKDGGGRATQGAVAGGGGRAASGTAAEYKPAPAPGADTETKPAPTEQKSETAAVPPKPAARPAKGWAVQVGVFANPANAAKLADRLKGQGHEVMLDHVTYQNAKRLRLRVGPFADKPQAVEAQAKIQQVTGLAGAVVGYP
jgi:DedD protein